MPSRIATFVCVFFSIALFLLQRDRKSRTSWAVWIPLAWLALCASRGPSQWLGGVGTEDSSNPFVEGNSFDASIFAGLLAAGLVVLSRRKKRVRSFLRVNGPLLI